MRTYVCTYFAGTRIISTHVRRKSDNELVQVTYYTTDNDDEGCGSEIYSGENYIVSSTKASYSRNYKQFLKGYPKEYMPVLIDLIKKATDNVSWKNFVGNGHTFEA